VERRRQRQMCIRDRDMVTSFMETTPSGIAEALLLVYKNEKLKAERTQNGLLFLQNTILPQVPLLFKEG
jgi:hypothetical protein